MSDHLRKLLEEYKERREALELQQAQFGFTADPRIVMEIKDIKDKEKHVKEELKRLSIFKENVFEDRDTSQLFDSNLSSNTIQYTLLNEDDKPIKIPEILIRSLRESRCILFVGQNLSIEAGLPSEKEIIREFVQNSGICQCKYVTDSHMECAGLNCCCRWGIGRSIQCYVLLHGLEAAINILRDLIDRPCEPSILHKKIANIQAVLSPFTSIVTTNYDRILDKVIYELNSDFHIINDNRKIVNNSRYIIKINGCISEEKSLIITDDGYILKRKLGICDGFSEYIADKIILFVGCNLNTPEFKALYDEFLYRNSNLNYIVMQTSEIEELYWRSHGLTTIRCSELEFLEILEIEAIIYYLIGLLESPFQEKVVDKTRLRIIRERLNDLLNYSIIDTQIKTLLAKSFIYFRIDTNQEIDLLVDKNQLNSIIIELSKSINPQVKSYAISLMDDSRIEHSITDLLENLESSHLSIYESTFRTLNSLGSNRIAKMILSSNDYRVKCIEILQHILLFHDDLSKGNRTRQFVLDIFINIGEKSSSTHSLLKQLMMDDDKEIREKVLSHLDKFFEREEIISILRDSVVIYGNNINLYNETRGIALKMLVSMEDQSEETKILLERLILDDDTEIFNISIYALSKLYNINKIINLLVEINIDLNMENDRIFEFLEKTYIFQEIIEIMIIKQEYLLNKTLQDYSLETTKKYEYILDLIRVLLFRRQYQLENSLSLGNSSEIEDEYWYTLELIQKFNLIKQSE